MNHSVDFKTLVLGLLLFATHCAIAGDKFSDRDRLSETLLRDDHLAVVAAEEDLAAAQADLDAAVTGNASVEEIAALNAKRLEAVANLEEAQHSFALEEPTIETQLEALSDEQVFALNRSLNNAVSSGLNVDIDSEHLQDVIDGDYDGRQINALTKALEEEAKFTKLSDKFQDKYEASGNERFLEHSERMLDKGVQQKEKFLSKIDKFDAKRDATELSLKRGRMRNELDLRRDSPRQVKGDMKRELRQEIKHELARDLKRDVRGQAKQAAKQVVREQSKHTAKGKGKGHKG
ncbi:MAG: hypothetical protein ACREV4_09005 [Gammaproteobacteria bacterium]